jgi:hypothetical protein
MVCRNVGHFLFPGRLSGYNREGPGDVIERDITWTSPAGNKLLAKKLKIPVRATAEDLV